MNCISPPELEDWQLFKYLDGEIDGEISHHLEICQFCRDKKDSLALFQERLKSRLTCPSSMELGEFELNMLSKGRELVVAQHLRECPYCEREIAQLRDFLGNSSLEPKDNLLEKAKVFFARSIGKQKGPDSPAESLFTPAFPVLRGEGKNPIIIKPDDETEDILLSLTVLSNSNGQVGIQGQVIPNKQDDKLDEWTGAEVLWQQVGLPDLTTSVDNFGTFLLEEVHPGSVQITITSSHGERKRFLKVNIST